MTKRECVISAINGLEVDSIPSSFSLHFPVDKAYGSEGVKSHLDFFMETDTDILKIMNENLVPFFGNIRSASDYQKMIPKMTMKDEFMVNQMDMTKKILEKCDKTRFSMGTMHGIVASSIHPLEKMGLNYQQARELHVNILRENPKKVIDGMKRIADVMSELAIAYVSSGVDGVYYAALGAETRYFNDEEFHEWIEPLDKQIMSAIKEAGGYCFLHMCKDNLNMRRYTTYSSYADVVNWGIYEAPFSMQEGRKLFPNKTIMGGLPNRHGVLVDGSVQDVKDAVWKVIRDLGNRGLILGADCTLDTKQDLTKVLAAVQAAREYKITNI